MPHTLHLSRLFAKVYDASPHHAYDSPHGPLAGPLRPLPFLPPYVHACNPQSADAVVLTCHTRADSVFRHLGGDTSVIQVYSALSLVDCLFTQNLLTQTDLGVPLALIRLSGAPLPNGVGPSLRMEAVSAINNPHPFTVSATVPTAVYSDFPVSIVILEGPIENPSAPNKDFKPLRSKTLQDLDYIEQPGVKRFLSERTPEFLKLQDVRSRTPDGSFGLNCVKTGVQTGAPFKPRHPLRSVCAWRTCPSRA